MLKFRTMVADAADQQASSRARTRRRAPCSSPRRPRVTRSPCAAQALDRRASAAVERRAGRDEPRRPTPAAASRPRYARGLASPALAGPPGMTGLGDLRPLRPRLRRPGRLDFAYIEAGRSVDVSIIARTIRPCSAAAARTERGRALRPLTWSPFRSMLRAWPVRVISGRASLALSLAMIPESQLAAAPGDGGGRRPSSRRAHGRARSPPAEARAVVARRRTGAALRYLYGGWIGGRRSRPTACLRRPPPIRPGSSSRRASGRTAACRRGSDACASPLTRRRRRWPGGPGLPAERQAGLAAACVAPATRRRLAMPTT